MKKVFFIFSLLLLFSSAAFGDNTDPVLTRAMEKSGFTTNQMLQVQNSIKTAQIQGVPSNALSGKVHEGIAKHVDPERIIQAMEKVTARYEYGYTLARQITKEKSQVTPLGNSITAGIAAGLSREDARELADKLQTRSRQLSPDDLYSLAEETMLTARDLCRQGVSSTTAEDMVGKALQKGFATGEMHTMRNTFNKREADENRESLARNFSRAIDHGTKADDLESQGRSDRGFEGGHQSGNGPGDSAGSSGGGDHESSGGSGGSDSSGHSAGNDSSGNSGGSSGSGGDHDSSGGGSSGGSSSSGGSAGSEGSDHGSSGGGNSGGGGSGGSGGSDHGGHH
ncbi:MAG: hypothetical protein JRC87_07480 [Deltaproteobacteria bacterium]|nr:hypothetical protein [Deltaproteobacteria bacterium]MBW2659414.1 hypothetical protein [Deltaproteobacteria bacterium]